MKYPNFLKKGDYIGITALSSGTGDKIKEVKTSLNHLKEYYKLIVTPNVYGDEIVSSDAKERIKEFNELLDEDIKLLMNIRGGDFLYETLDGLDFQKIVKKNIWVEGYSDITNLLYILTTKYDLATIYGLNAKSFDNEILEEYQLNNIDFLNGKKFKQFSFNNYKTISLKENFSDNGILIGGCIDTLRYLFGTEYDNTLNFIEKYRDKGIIWYFDIYAMGSVDLYLTLLQMKKMGYFKYSDTFLFGRVLLPKIECNLSYQDAITKALGDKNIILEADIGHVKPVFTLINGCLYNVTYQKNKLVMEVMMDNENNG